MQRVQMNSVPMKNNCGQIPCMHCISTRSAARRDCFISELHHRLSFSSDVQKVKLCRALCQSMRKQLLIRYKNIFNCQCLH